MLLQAVAAISLTPFQKPSCSWRGRVCFARDLLDLSPALQDYVIAHELLHMRHPNHGRVSYALLTAHIPRWRQRHSQLRVRAVSS